MTIEKEYIGEKGEVVVVKTEIKSESITDNRPDSETYRQEILVLKPSVVEDHGSWTASWDMISYDQAEADTNMEILKAEHIK